MHIVTPARMREIEGYAIGQLGIDGLILMERAALSLAQEIRAASPPARGSSIFGEFAWTFSPCVRSKSCPVTR